MNLSAHHHQIPEIQQESKQTSGSVTFIKHLSTKGKSISNLANITCSTVQVLLRLAMFSLCAI